MFVPANGIRVDVKGGGICDIASGHIRNDRDVIADLLVLRKAGLRIERIADRNVRSPCHAGVGAIRIE